MQFAPSDRLAVQLLGPFKLRLGNVDAGPRGRKARGLIAYVAASEGGKASRVRLADLLWGDRGEEQARSSLRQAILEVRTSPAGRCGALVIGREQIACVERSFTTDIEEIRAAARARDGTALAALLGEMEGRFLDDLDGLSPAFDDWLATARLSHEEAIFAHVLPVLPELMAGRQRASLPPILRALERLDPLNEQVVRLRLQLDHAEGDTAAMHRRWRRLSDDLERDLGVQPSLQTRTLFNELLLEPVASGSPPTPSPASPAATASKTAPTVLVAPFAASGMTESGETGEIWTENIRAALSRNSELRVLATTSSDEERAAAIAQRAIGGYRLSGSVRASDERFTVTVELANISSGLVSWSEQIRFVGATADGTDDVVARIVAGIGPAIERDLADSLATSFDPDGGAAALYARGRHLTRDGRSLPAVREGVELLEKTLAVDPRHIGARMRLAPLYNTDFHFLMAGHDVESLRARARRLIEEAAALDPSNVRIQLRRAWCDLRRGDWAAAEHLFRRSIEVMPHDADALNECAFGFACLGELTLAEQLMQRAFRLNPFAPAEYHADYAVLLALAGDLEAAEEHFAVCGEQRLFYLAMRLANLHRSGAGQSRTRDLGRRFVADFLAIWQPQRAATLEDLLYWVDTSVCLRRAQDRQLVADGVTGAWIAAH